MAIAVEKQRLATKEPSYTFTVPGIDRPFQASYQAATLPFLALLGRLAFGFYFAWSGFEKLIEGFSAEGFLVNATSGPLKDVFVSWGESATALAVIDPLVVWGEILIGVGLFFGVLTRAAAFFGATMLFLFYLAQFPPEFNPFLDEYIFYIGALAVIGALGAGRILGIDRRLEQAGAVARRPWLRWLLG